MFLFYNSSSKKLFALLIGAVILQIFLGVSCRAAAEEASAVAENTLLPCWYSGTREFTEHPSCLEIRGTKELFVTQTNMKGLSFSRGLAALYSKKYGWMYANRQGRIIIRGVMVMDNGPDDFHDGLVRYESGKKCGFANQLGKAVVLPQYDGCLNFKKGTARVCKGCHSECVDKACENHDYQGGEWVCLNTAGKPVQCEPITHETAAGVSILNETGAEVRDLWVGVPGGAALPGAPLPSLAAGASVTLPLRGEPASLSVQYRRKPDRSVERTVRLMLRATGASIGLTLREDDGVSLSLSAGK